MIEWLQHHLEWARLRNAARHPLQQAGQVAGRRAPLAAAVRRRSVQEYLHGRGAVQPVVVAVKVCDIVPRDVADTLPTLVRQQLDGIAQWQ